MSRFTDKSLSDDDRVLWSLVARSTKPLKGTKSVSATEVEQLTMADAMAQEAPIGSRNMAVAAPSQRPAHGHPTALDRPTRDKLSSGKLPIEGRVDLHGMTQHQAHALLLSFLIRAYAGGVRYVLIITGKGNSSGGEGVLRRAVPGWLATPAFRALVSSHDNAARNHGGAGALYVRLRRRSPS